jgi:preprotein translocase subunit SecF
MISFFKYRKIYYLFSFLLIVLSLGGFFTWGLNWGIDFQGGMSLSLDYLEEIPAVSQVREKVESLGFPGSNVQLIGSQQIEIQINRSDISQEEKEELIQGLGELAKVDEESFNFRQISPIIGQQLRNQTLTVVIWSIILILVYISLAFRKIHHPLPSWQYGLAALIALFHDLLIVAGVFVWLGHFVGFQVNIASVTALLVVFGYSVNDTVVVFDRIRENLLRSSNDSYQEIVDSSLNQTLVRSLNTSLTTLFVLLSIFFFGGATLHAFALSLAVGVTIGTYSSVFLASPMLVSWQRWRSAKA